MATQDSYKFAFRIKIAYIFRSLDILCSVWWYWRTIKAINARICNEIDLSLMYYSTVTCCLNINDVICGKVVFLEINQVNLCYVERTYRFVPVISSFWGKRTINNIFCVRFDYSSTIHRFCLVLLYRVWRFYSFNQYSSWFMRTRCDEG